MTTSQVPVQPHPMPNDPQVLAYMDCTNAFYPPQAYTFTLDENRTWYNRYAAHMRKPRPDCLRVHDFVVSGSTTRPAVAVRHYTRRDQRVCADTTLLYLHGGGFILGGLDSHDDACAGWCADTGLDVLAVDYRLAPEHLHPAQGDDVQTVFLHLTQEGQRVVVAGDSAGGNLVAALCLRQRAQGGALPVGQLLIYPGLGGDQHQGSYLSRAHAPMLTTQECQYYFGIRADGLAYEDVSDVELRPLLEPRYDGLPPAFVVTADIDPLRDDGAAYVQRLLACGVTAVYRNEPELVHGYLRARHMSTRAAQSFAAIGEAALALAQGRLQSA